VGEQAFVGSGIADLVRTKLRTEVLDVRGGRHVAGIERLQAGEGLQDVIEGGREPLLLLPFQTQAPQRPHPPPPRPPASPPRISYRRGGGCATRCSGATSNQQCTEDEAQTNAVNGATFGAPLPLLAANTPVCVVNRFASTLHPVSRLSAGRNACGHHHVGLPL